MACTSSRKLQSWAVFCCITIATLNGFTTFSQLFTPTTSRRAEETPSPSTDGAALRLLADVHEGIAAIGGASRWKDTAAVIADGIGRDPHEAEMLLARAYGWKAWAELNRPSYLRPKLPPGPDEVRKAINWLTGAPLQLTREQLAAALNNSPKVYLSEPERSYAAALESAPEMFGEPGAFRELLLREPQVLDLTWNCERTDPASRPLDAWGEAIHCDGQCVHCWRTATPKLMGQVLDGVEV